jgi:hypothetical protein
MLVVLNAGHRRGLVSHKQNIILQIPFSYLDHKPVILFLFLMYQYQGIRGWWERFNEILTIRNTQWRNCEWNDNRDVFTSGKYNRKNVVVHVPAVTRTVHTCLKRGRADKYVLYLVHSLARSFQLSVSNVRGPDSHSSGGKLAESWS